MISRYAERGRGSLRACGVSALEGEGMGTQEVCTHSRAGPPELRAAGHPDPAWLWLWPWKKLPDLVSEEDWPASRCSERPTPGRQKHQMSVLVLFYEVGVKKFERCRLAHKNVFSKFNVSELTCSVLTTRMTYQPSGFWGGGCIQAFDRLTWAGSSLLGGHG